MIVLVILFILIGIVGFLFMLRLTMKSKSMPIHGANEEFNLIIARIARAANGHILDRANNQINAFIYRYQHQIPRSDLRWYEERLQAALKIRLVEFGGAERITINREFGQHNNFKKDRGFNNHSPKDEKRSIEKDSLPEQPASDDDAVKEQPQEVKIREVNIKDRRS